MIHVLASVKKFDKMIEKNVANHHFSISPEIQFFFKWLPLLYVLIADMAGAKTRNRFIARIIIVAFSEIILNSVVQPFKKLSRRRRPYSLFNFNSFPSGHTATSFSGAEILRYQVKEYSACISVGGYMIALVTAALRLYERKHWISDIAAGAIIGIVSARLSQLIFDHVFDNRHV